MNKCVVNFWKSMLYLFFFFIFFLWIKWWFLTIGGGQRKPCSSWCSWRDISQIRFQTKIYQFPVFKFSLLTLYFCRRKKQRKITAVKCRSYILRNVAFLTLQGNPPSEAFQSGATFRARFSRWFTKLKWVVILFYFIYKRYCHHSQDTK